MASDKYFRTLICVFVILAMISVSLAGCGGEKASGNSEAKSAAEQPAAEASSQTAEAPEEKVLLPHESAEEEQGETLLPHEMPSSEEENSTTEENVVTAMTHPSFFDGIDAGYAAPEAAVPEYSVEAGLSNVSNANDFYLSDGVKKKIEENGFAVAESSGKEFFSIYERNRYDLLPNFVTVDSMMHTYHLYFSYLLKNTERNYLSNTMAELSALMLEKSLEQREALAGTEWEEAAARNVRFFAVGAELFGRESGLEGDDAAAVSEELSKIYDASGIMASAIFDAEEDYSQYKPRGYYEEEEALQTYFRAMMWFGRMNFRQMDEDLDRSALLITLAMDDETLPLWESVYAVTSFFAGSSDDNGYYEYKPVIDAVYGENASPADLPGNGPAWAEYHSLTEQMAAPKINSLPVRDQGEGADHGSQNKGFRFMGQRFSLDAAIFQTLMYSSIQKADDGSARMLPDALDVPAVMGSEEAKEILLSRGNDKYPNYVDTLDKLRSGVAEADDYFWCASLASRWLYTLLPLTAEKGEGWPMFMQSREWARKDLQTYLGSYTELKHDTVLYAKQAFAEMGGDAVEEKDDRGYVEPEPEVFARLSVLTEATKNGLSGYGILDPEDEENLNRLKALSDMLCTISEKELRNEPLTDDEYDLIRTYGGQLEHFWKEAYREKAERVTVFEFPAAIVTDVATDPNGSALEIATGWVNTIYVAVPVDGKLRIAAGSVYSFYQFEQSLSDRLTDTDWRYMLGVFYSQDASVYGEAPAPEDWTDGFTVRNAS